MVIYKKKRSSRLKKPLLIGGALLLIAGGILVVLEKKGVTNFYEKKPVAVSTEDKTTSDVPSAQENFTEGDEREPGNTDGENDGTGDIEDLQGVSNGQTDAGKWITSKTGEIVVHSPYANQTISSGTELSGTSSLSKVSYRILDNVSGEIAQGNLSVVNGTFSGKISFQTNATEGRIDVYATRNDASEFSNVEIPIKYD